MDSVLIITGRSRELLQCKSEEKREETLPSLHTKTTWNLREASCGHSWHDTSTGFCLQLSPATNHCVGSTNTATQQKMWHSPSLLSYLSLNGWRRQSLQAGCATLFLLPLWFGGGKENSRISSEEPARTAVPPTWLKATAPSIQETRCARWNRRTWGNTVLRKKNKA